MTRRELQRKLRRMDGVLEALHGLPTERERERLNEKYRSLSVEVAPYVEGRKKLDEAAS